MQDFDCCLHRRIQDSQKKITKQADCLGWGFPTLPRIVFVFRWSRWLSSIIDYAIHEIRDRECIIPCVIPFIPRGVDVSTRFSDASAQPRRLPLSNKGTPQKCFQLQNLQGRLKSWSTWSGTFSEWSKCMKGSSASSGLLRGLKP